jgi:predicted nucleic acid-binding Zn ribbon protein
VSDDEETAGARIGPDLPFGDREMPATGQSGEPEDNRAAEPALGATASPISDVAAPPTPRPDTRGPELARAVLDAARARRPGRPRRTTEGGRPTGERAPGGRGWRPRGYSGPGPDPRDPQPIGSVLDRLIRARGWQRPAAEATVFGAWERVVGPDVAQHSRPVKLQDGELTVEAESTAWATQLRLLAASLLKRIAGEVGHNVVKKLHIHGPAAPSWNKGPRRVQGRGPRDTYG